jgi:hypothetical protein
MREQPYIFLSQLRIKHLTLGISKILNPYMKKYVIIFVIFVLCKDSTLCQSKNERLDYFPIHIGDTWHYRFIDDYFDGYIIKSTKTIKIIGDTLLANNKRYYIFKNQNKHLQSTTYQFIRIDTLNLKVIEYSPSIFCIDTEKVLYDLSIKPLGWKNCNDPYEVYKITETSSPQQVGSLGLQSNQISYISGYWIFNRTLAKGFGLSYCLRGELMLGRDTLTYAKINGIEYGNPVSVEKEKDLPANFILYQNYPNPFNPITRIDYEISVSDNVSIKVYDSLGNEIVTLLNKYQNIGKHNVVFDGRNLSSGIYLYKILVGSYSSSRKMLLLK